MSRPELKNSKRSSAARKKAEASNEYDRFFPKGSPEERHFRLTRSFRQAFRLWRNLLEGRLREFGFTRAKWTVLSAIVLSGEGKNQNELAKQLGIEGPTLVRLLDSLEKAGFVSRMPSPTDRRAKLIIATTAGKELAEILVKETKEIRATYLYGMTDAEIASLTELLEKLARTDRWPND